MAWLTLQITTGTTAGSKWCAGCELLDRVLDRCALFGQLELEPDDGRVWLPVRNERCRHVEIQPSPPVADGK